MTISTTFSQDLEKFYLIEGLSPALQEVIKNLRTHQEFEPLALFIRSLDVEALKAAEGISFFGTYQALQTFFEVDDEVLKTLLSIEDLSPIKVFLEKLTQYHIPCTKEIFMCFCLISSPQAFIMLLDYFNDIKILSTNTFGKLLRIAKPEWLHALVYRIQDMMESYQISSLIAGILKHPMALELLSILVKVELDSPKQISYFLKLTHSTQFYVLQNLAQSGYFELRPQIKASQLQHLSSIKAEHLRILFSGPFSRHFLDDAMFNCLFKHQLTEKNAIKLIECLGLLEAHHRLKDNNECLQYAEFILQYDKPFPIFHLIEEILRENIVDSFKTFSLFFSKQENSFAIRSCILGLSEAQASQIPSHLQVNFSEFRAATHHARALFLLCLDILKTPKHLLNQHFRVLCHAHFMQTLEQVLAVPSLDETFLQTLIEDPTDYALGKNLKLIHAFNQIESVNEKKLNLFNAPFFNDLLFIISGFSDTQSIIQHLIRLYALKRLRTDNYEEMACILESLDANLHEKDLKIAFFKAHTAEVSIEDFICLINQDMDIIIASINERLPIHLPAAQECLTQLQEHPHRDTIIDIIAKIPEKKLLEDGHFVLVQQIIQHLNKKDLLHLLQHLNDYLIKNPHAYDCIIAHPYPRIFLHAFESSHTLQETNIKTRMRYLENIKVFSETAKNFLEKNSLAEPHHLMTFLAGAVKEHQLGYDEKLSQYLNRLDFLGWMHFCYQTDLLHLQNIHDILGVSNPRLCLNALQALMKTFSFRFHHATYFKIMIQSHAPLKLVELLIQFERRGLVIIPSLFNHLGQSPDLENILSITRILFLDKNFHPSMDYHTLIQSILLSKHATLIQYLMSRVHTNCNMFQFYQLLYIILNPEKAHEARHLIQINFFKNFIKHPGCFEIFLDILKSPYASKIIEILYKIEEKKLFSGEDYPIIMGFFNLLLKHREFKQILILLPIVLNIKASADKTKENIKTLLTYPIDNLFKFTHEYPKINQELLDILFNSFFHYDSMKAIMSQLIERAYIRPDDIEAQLKFIQICIGCDFSQFLTQVESFELVSQTNRAEFFRQVLFHPKANEIVKIFGFLRIFRVNFQAANFPKLFELIIASPNPYVTCCLIGNFQKLNLLPYWFGFNVSQLVYQTNAQELSICLSNNYDFLVEMTEMDSLCLIILCAKKDVPSQVIELFKFLLLNLPGIYPVDVIQIMQKKPSFSHPIELLKKIQRHQRLNIHLVDTIFSHPKSDDLLALISFYQKYFTLNEELLGRILSEEHPLAIAKFLNLADSFSLCTPAFFEEFSRVKDIIFYSPAVVDRFLRIRKEYFLEINLKQFLIIANQLIAEPDKASEALLKLCNQLSHHSTHSQVTHLASIHQSASETALRLARRYQDVEIDIYELFSFLKQEITKLPQTHETQAAIRCLDKMLAPQYKHKVDKDSNVSLQELLAYCILAIQDTSEVLAELPVCVSALTQGLYEIQRGYNKSEEQQVDQAICDGGTFNKLIEVLVGIHPDFQQVVMNLGMASAKFVRIVIHHIQKYISELPSPTTIEEKEQFRALIQNLMQEGPGVIWNDIVEDISKELFEEFSQVFESPDNVSFTTILSCGRDTDVTELDAFFNTMMANKVYHYDSRFFSRRFEDANIQHEFDKNYGLITYPYPS